MAKNTGRLAGLAALAGAAYLYNNKDKDKGPKGKEDTGPGYQSTETRLKTPTESIAESDKSDKSSSISTKGESGTTTPGPDKSAPDLSESRNKPAAPKKPAAATSSSTSKTVEQKKPAASSTVSEAGTSRGTRPADSSKAYPSGVMGGSRQADSIKSKVVDATKRAGLTAVKAVTQGPIANATNSSNRVPTSEEAAANRQAAYDKVKSVGSSVVDYVKNFETPAERRAREAKNPPPKTSSTRDYNEDALSSGSAMRRGGAVKKMASGGMTASRRADGIATKGKTRCRMY